MLQHLCRTYLLRLRYVADKHGLGTWVKNIVKANRRKECEGTQREVEMLARMLCDESVSRSEIPALLGKSYRSCCEEKEFERIKRIKTKGTYSKVDTLLRAVRRKA